MRRLAHRARSLRLCFGNQRTVRTFSPTQVHPDPRIQGPFLILSTPFTASGAVDFDALARQACYVDWCGCPGMIWPQSGDSVDLLTTDEKLKGMEVLAKTARKLSTTALCLGVQGKDTAEMLMFAEHVEKLAPPAIISRPPDSGKTEDDLRQYWHALASVTKRPVFIQTTGGVAYKGPTPSVDLLIELAKDFPNFGYVKEEAGNVIARTRALVAAKPPIRRVFGARGGYGWLYELRLGSEGLITERAIYADVLTRIWQLHQSGSDPGGSARCVQQVPPHDQPRQDPSRRLARLPVVPLEETRRVPDDGLASLRTRQKHPRIAHLLGAGADQRGDRRDRVPIRSVEAVPEARIAQLRCGRPVASLRRFLLAGRMTTKLTAGWNRPYCYPTPLSPPNPGAAMKRLSWFAVCCLSVACASAADFHVSPDGSDENPATVTAPVKSLEKARDLARAARKAKPDEPIQILLHPGIYMVRKTVEFTKDDSGTESAPLTIKAWKDLKSPNDWPKLVGADRTESIPNREFPAASEEQLKTNANQTAAQGWFWYHKQFPDVKSEVVTNDKGKRALRFAAANNAEMKYIKYACVRSEPFGFDPGKDYRLAFKLLTTDASGSTTARLVGEANGLWRASRLAIFQDARRRTDGMPDRLSLSCRGRRGL